MCKSNLCKELNIKSKSQVLIWSLSCDINEINNLSFIQQKQRSQEDLICLGFSLFGGMI